MSLERRRERERLEEVHQELCNGLTAARNFLTLAARAALKEQATPGAVLVVAHLTDANEAIDRLERLARHVREWHETPAS